MPSTSKLVGGVGAGGGEGIRKPFSSGGTRMVSFNNPSMLLETIVS